MIIQELYDTWPDGTKLIRTYSDEGYKLCQIETGDIYDEAIDIEGRFTYEETEYKIDEDTPEEEIEEVIVEE